MQWGSWKLKIVSQVLIYFTISITFIFAIDLALSCLPFFCTFYILFFNISEMGEPPVLILGHSFICRLNNFSTNSAYLESEEWSSTTAVQKWIISYILHIHILTIIFFYTRTPTLNGVVKGVKQLKKLFAMISMWWSRLPPILWYYSWELMIFPT